MEVNDRVRKTSKNDFNSQPYVNQYNDAREKYENDVKDYNDKHGIVVSDKKRKKSEKVFYNLQ